MKDKPDKGKGFSLTEVLLAVGTLAIGMIFVAGIFPAGLVLSTKATERTMAAIVADEAFAKVKLIAGDPSFPISADDFQPGVRLQTLSFDDTVEALHGEEINLEFLYPSLYEMDPDDKRYCWSAICRQVGPSQVQVTVFVCRRVGGGSKYLYVVDWQRLSLASDGDRPRPIAVPVKRTLDPNAVEVVPGAAARFINDGYTIVSDASGQFYRVLRRHPPNILNLDGPWQEEGLGDEVWVVPPPERGGRYPCIAVHQKVIQF
ncbi:MAG: type IV pilus modification PilV family protein [Planctomycetota bacterium]|jgi:hypothetical protein